MPFIGSPFAFPPGTMLSAIQRLGLTTDLVLCLDAGDAASYDGSSQTWTDVSGQGNSFFRGSTSASQASDPTFNGSAGSQSASAYFSFDGGDWLTESSAHTFADSWHKNNAVWTFVMVFYRVSDAAHAIFYNSDGTTEHGVGIQIAGSDQAPFVNAFNGSGSAALSLNPSAALALTKNAWNFYAVALNEATGANGATVRVNGNSESLTSTYSSPSSTNPTRATLIGATGDTSLPLPSGSRLAAVAAWNTRLTDTNLENLYTLLKAKYSLA
jgi:hypothetical protein